MLKLMQRLPKTNQQGFTLIELLVVIAIISVLAGLLLVNFVGVRGRAEDTRKKSDARQLKTALRLYYNDYQRYPQAAGAGTTFAGCGATGTSSCGAGAAFSAGSPATTYMAQIPSNWEMRYYAPAAPANAFLIRVTLENASDADIAASQTRCNPTSRSYYNGGAPQATHYFVCED